MPNPLPKILFLIAIFLIAIAGTAGAESISVGNHSLSSLSSSGILPSMTYATLNTTFSANLTDNANITTVLWYVNSSVISDQENINLTSYQSNVTNYSFADAGTYNLTFEAFDALGNNLTDTISPFSVSPYILPLITNLIPASVNPNQASLVQVIIATGSFPLSNITWDVNNDFFSNTAQVGDNYQTYTFNNSGQNEVIVQACDTNDFCGELVGYIMVQSNTPTSYWAINNVSMAIDVPFPNVPETMSVQFIPFNDTNPLDVVAINWGDGSDIQQFLYTNSPIQPSQNVTYTHYYENIGNYSISMETCDSIDVCNVTFISNVSVAENIEELTSNLLLRSNPNQPTNVIVAAIQGWWQGQFGNILGTILFYLSIVAAVVVIGVIGFVWIVNWMARSGSGSSKRRK